MLYFNFKNYEEFKEMFGTRIANNGKKVRSNHILLSFLKHEFKCKRFQTIEFVNDIADMYRYVLTKLSMHQYAIPLVNGVHVYSKDYDIDSRRGVCEDLDIRCIRYVRKDNGSVYKMKAGKFMRNVLESCGLTEMFCEQTIIYVCEKFSEDWQAYIQSTYGEQLELHVDERFDKIYDSNECVGDFKSCMKDKDQYMFYENSVYAYAAYLTNSEDMIVARCVIFTKVHEVGSDKVYRLAERQYSKNQDNILKQVLIDKLIKADEIDGYKEVGVDCHSSRNFVLNDGTSLRDKRLWIHCDLDYDDTLSYQDSFKWYDMVSRRADNYGCGNIDLSTTERHFQGEWDSYHEQYCAETTTVNVWSSYHGRFLEETCDVDHLDDFCYCERYCEYYDETVWSDYEYDHIPRNELVRCEFKYDYLWKDRAIYCEIADDYFPEYEYEEYLEAWKEHNWEHDELNDVYVKETVEAWIWNGNDYDSMNVSIEYADKNFELYDGEFYSELNEDGIPFNMVEELEECEVV